MHRILAFMHPTPPAPAAGAGNNRHGRHRAARRTGRIVGRAAIALVSVFVVLATGLAYWEAHGLLGGITISRPSATGTAPAAGR